MQENKSGHFFLITMYNIYNKILCFQATTGIAEHTHTSYLLQTTKQRFITSKQRYELKTHCI